MSGPQGPFQPPPPEPADVESAFLNKLAASPDASALGATGLTPEAFTDPQCRRAFEIQLGHIARHGRPATSDIHRAHALAIRPVFRTEDDLATLAEHVRQSTAHHRLAKAAAQFLRTADTQAMPLIEAWSRLVADVSSPDVSSLLTDQAEGGSLEARGHETLAAMRRFRDAGGVTGIHTPWPALDAITGGLSPEDYLVILGFHKAGKSDMLIEIAVHAALRDGASVLVISNEMSFADVRNRMVCRVAGVDYARFRTGGMPDDERRMEAALAALRHHGDVHIHHITATGQAALAQARTLIDRRRPDVVCWDGHQLSAASNEWKDVYDLSRRTRALWMETKVAGVVTAQLNPDRTRASFKTYHNDCTCSVVAERCGAWMHCETPEVREGRPARWSMKVVRGMPLVQREWCRGSEGGGDVAQDVVVLPGISD